MEAVEVEEVTRVFEPRRRGSTRVVALDSVSLTIPTGEIHGLLGPNGGSRNSSNAEDPPQRGPGYRVASPRRAAYWGACSCS